MMGFGSSLRAFIELAEQKNYVFVGATEINAFFVEKGLGAHFEEYERDPMNLFPLTNYTFLVTDFLGGGMGAGVQPPWGVRLPYVGPPVSGNMFSLANSSTQSMDTYTAKYGASVVRWVQENQPNIANPDEVASVGHFGPISPRNLLRAYMQGGVEAICIAIDHVSSLDHVAWIEKEAEEYAYHSETGGGIIALTRSQQ